MKKVESKELVVIRESIFEKIKKFFKRLFGKKEEIEEIENVKEENTFIDGIKVEDGRLLELQGLIEEEVIKEEELQDDDVKALHKLYDEQILNLVNSINEYKAKIEELKVEANK